MNTEEKTIEVHMLEFGTSWIRECIDKMVAMAKEKKATIKSELNRVCVLVNENSNAELIYNAWHKIANTDYKKDSSVGPYPDIKETNQYVKNWNKKPQGAFSWLRRN